LLQIKKQTKQPHKSMKKKYNSYNATAISALEKKYDVSKQFIRQSLRGDRTSKTSDKIAADYKELVKEVDALIEKQ
jgi:Mor family transcriptional regulator